MDRTEHLFRRESGRMVAVLTRIFGVHNLALAEDVVQDAFCRALEVWKIRGIPPNPSAWLMQTAKNRALDILRRERKARQYAPEFGELLDSEWTLAGVVELTFREQVVRDDELRVMFSACHPQLPQEAQVAFMLNICCGFSVSEIASAFLVSNTAMEKRIQRARKVFTQSGQLFDLKSAKDLTDRLAAVLRTIYLLFSEGYHGASQKAAVRTELCHEAMRLCDLLCEHPVTSSPRCQALSALMCLNAGRLPARLDLDGHLTSLAQQDRSLWDQKLVKKGLSRLDTSATGSDISDYHIEAAIAAVHGTASCSEDTDWRAIVALYDMLMTITPSPIVALNRAIAVGQAEGPARGLEEISHIEDSARLHEYLFYHASLAELELRNGQANAALCHFAEALKVCRNTAERQFLAQRIAHCERLVPADDDFVPQS